MSNQVSLWMRKFLWPSTILQKDMDLFCKAMDGEWVVSKVEDDHLNGGRPRVFFRSLVQPSVVWSMNPDIGMPLPKIGSKGKIAFVQNQGQ